jgi:hypothetical protein
MKRRSTAALSTAGDVTFRSICWGGGMMSRGHWGLGAAPQKCTALLLLQPNTRRPHGMPLAARGRRKIPSPLPLGCELSFYQGSPSRLLADVGGALLPRQLQVPRLRRVVHQQDGRVRGWLGWQEAALRGSWAVVSRPRHVSYRVRSRSWR